MNKRFWVPYEPYDVTNIKIWLEEKAEQGFRLKKMKPYFAIFEETDRLSLKFHLEPTLKDVRKPEPEIIKSRLEKGWTYAGTVADFFHVFYADANTPEFYDDARTVKYMYEEKLKKQRWVIFVSFLTFLFFVFQMIRQDVRPVLYILENLNLFQLASIGFVLFGIVGTLTSYLQHRKIIRNFETEDSSISSSSFFRVFKILGIGAWSVVIILFAIQLVYSDFLNDRFGEINSKDEMPIIAINDLKSSENKEVEPAPFMYYQTRTDSVFLDDMIVSYQDEFIDSGARQNITLVTWYYEAKSEMIIDLLREEIIAQIESEGEYSQEDMEVVSGVKTSYFLDYYHNLLILSNGNRLLKVSYSGGDKLNNLREIILEKFLEYQVP